MNLIILQLLNPDLVARGNATVQASIRGSLKDPQLNGRMELKNASLYLGDLPNGVDNANGALVFDRNRATIEKLTAETGGGTVNFSGFIGFGSPLVYRLQAVGAESPRALSGRRQRDVQLHAGAERHLGFEHGFRDLITLTRASFTPRADLAQSSGAGHRARFPLRRLPASICAACSSTCASKAVRISQLQTSLTRNLEG